MTPLQDIRQLLKTALVWSLLCLWIGVTIESNFLEASIENEWSSQKESPEDGSDKEEIDWDEALAWDSKSDALSRKLLARTCSLNERWQETLRDKRLLDPPDGAVVV